MQIEKVNPERFDEIYALMEVSFPADERRTYSGQKALLERPAYGIYASTAPETGRIQAIAAVWELEELTFLEHLAVNPSDRNGGIGAAFLTALVARAGKPVCLEVEKPGNELAARRIRFYQRNGFFLNEYDYVQPALAEGQKPVPLLVMTSGGPVTKPEFERIKGLLYEKVYETPV